MVYPDRIFEQLVGEFLVTLRACHGRPIPEQVHTLRITARRMEALLRMVQEREVDNPRRARKIKQALEPLKTIRKAAGSVRDLDVQRGLLRDLLARSGTAQSTSERMQSRSEGRRVEAELRRCRTDAGKRFFAVIQATESQAEGSLKALASELYDIEWKSLWKDTLAWEKDSERHLRRGSLEGLHAYRKRGKFVRYIAEMEVKSAPAKRFAKNLKKVLDSIGNWHDWTLLSERSMRILGESSALVGALKMEERRSWRRAVRSVDGWRKLRSRDEGTGIRDETR